MNKEEAMAQTLFYIWSKRNGYPDLFCYEYMPPEVKDLLYKNRRRLTKFFNQHTKRKNFNALKR